MTARRCLQLSHVVTNRNYRIAGSCKRTGGERSTEAERLALGEGARPIGTAPELTECAACSASCCVPADPSGRAGLSRPAQRPTLEVPTLAAAADDAVWLGTRSGPMAAGVCLSERQGLLSGRAQVDVVLTPRHGVHRDESGRAPERGRNIASRVCESWIAKAGCRVGSCDRTLGKVNRVRVTVDDLRKTVETDVRRNWSDDAWLRWLDAVAVLRDQSFRNVGQVPGSGVVLRDPGWG